MLDVDLDDGRFFCHGKTYRYSKESLSFLTNRHKFRRVLVWIITWNWFESFIIFSIVANSIILGMMDYTNPKADNWRNNLVN